MPTHLAPSPDVESDFVHLLQQRAADTPGRLAFRFLDDPAQPGDQRSYEQVDRRARAIAAAMQQRGLAGERAVLLLQPSADYVLAILACWYAGATAVPVYAPRANASLDRIRLILRDAQARAVLSTAAVLDALDGDEWQALRGQGLVGLAVDRIPDSFAGDWRMPDLRPDGLAVLQYTSGSTGRPKGVRLQHRHLISNSRMIARAMHCTTDSVGVVWIPPYHDMGLIGGVLQPLFTGFPVHLMAPATFLQRPMRWLETLSRVRGTISAAPNFAFDLCVKRARPDQLESLDLSSWVVAANGAEPIRDDTMRRFSALFAPAGFDPRAFFPCYGMAETTLLVSAAAHFGGRTALQASRPALAVGQLETVDEGGITLVSSGRACAGARVAIVDPAGGGRCEDGQVGEIWVSGEAVADGYWGRPEDGSFQARLPGDEGCWLRTGDLGLLHGDELFVTGRLKDLIVVRGHNHYPHDIEATATAAHPALRPRGAAAFAVETEDGEAVGIAIEVERGCAAEDLQAAGIAVRDAVSREHQLQVAELMFVRPNTIPKTSSGKVQRLLTRQRWSTGQLETLVAEVVA